MPFIGIGYCSQGITMAMSEYEGDNCVWADKHDSIGAAGTFSLLFVAAQKETEKKIMYSFWPTGMSSHLN